MALVAVVVPNYANVALPSPNVATSIADQLCDVIPAAIAALPTDADVNAACDTALSDFAGPTKAQMDSAHALLATPTNITAGTITTVTNLTNAPTNGDLTSTMKTSIGTIVDVIPAKLGAYSGDGGAAADDSVKAQLDLLPGSINVARNGVAFTIVFPLYKNDGTLITGATGVDSEVSKNCGTFIDCTNEAAEIATNSGWYWITLTATEMTATQVCYMMKTSSTDAVIPTIAIYPKS